MPTRTHSAIVHQGQEAPDVLLAFLENLGDEQPDWRVGASVFLPRRKPNTIERMATNLDTRASFVIADPETHRLEMPFAERGVARDDQQYLRESNPRVNVDRFVSDVLEAQVHAERDILISPSLLYGASPSRRNLRATLAFAQASHDHDLVDDRTLLYGFAITESILVNDTLRNAFVDEVVDLPPHGLYLRVRITAPRSFMHYANTQALSGLRSVCEALSANGFPVVLPQMGLLGWLVLPFGASSFGTGIAGSLQRFVEPGGFGQPLEWWFCPALLGFVLRSEIAELQNVNGFIECDCPYCPDLTFSSSATWDRRTAGLHYLWWAAFLANETVDSTTPEPQGIQDRIAAAQEFWGAVQQEGLLLDERSHPLHLEAWSEAVA